MALFHVCHIEFDAVDMDRAQAFYEAMFGWTFKSFMGGEMRVFGVGDSHVGGLMRANAVQAGTSPSVWIKVDSCDRVLDIAKSVGGTVVKEKGEVPGVGYSAQIRDPEGNIVGIVEYTC